LRIFGRDNRDTVGELAFNRTVLHQTLSFNTYITSPHWISVAILVIHVEVNGSNFLKLFMNRDLFETKLESPDVAFKAIEKIRADSSNLPLFFPSADFTHFTQEAFENMTNGGEALGFMNPLLKHTKATALSMLRGQTVWPELESLDSLSIGNFLSNLFEDPKYFPEATEINFIWSYLAKFEINSWGGWQPSSNFTIGYFSNFKFVLKSLSDTFEELIANGGESELISSVAGCLGSGYGQVDAYLSKGYLIPMSVMQQAYSRMRPLANLPEFGGRAYPSLATAQYLSRKGIRLLRQIEENCSPIVATRFKVNALNAADVLDEGSDKFAEYQVLVNRIVFGDSTGNLKSGRKTSIPEAPDYQALSEGFSSTFGQEESEIIKNWTESIAGNNSIITNLAFELAQEVGGSFLLNQSTINSLSTSRSVRARKAILEFISANPDKLLWVNHSALASFLVDLSDETLEIIFDKYFYNRWTLFSSWASYCISKELTPREIDISKIFLAKGYASGSHAVPAFLIKLAEHTQFEPFEEWQNLVSVRDRLWIGTEDLLNFLGVDSGKKGVFSVIKKLTPWLCEVYAKDLASTLVSYSSSTWEIESNQALVNATLGRLISSEIESLRSVAMLMIQNKLLSESQVVAFYSSLSDPKILFDILKFAVEAGDEKSLLAYLNDLSREEKRTFWRMLSKETEVLFADWTDFAKFFWSSLASLQTYIIEILGSYDWMQDSIMKEITPSSVAKLDVSQAEYFVELLKVKPGYLEDARLLRAILIAPDAKINQLGEAHVRDNDLFADYWLLMLESNLPVTSRAAEQYLESQLTSKDFHGKVMLALDSNNKFARTAALRILKSANSPKLLGTVVQQLAENRNQDTWGLVAGNLNLIEEAKNLQTFTRRVFLSRRKGRAQKEQVKVKIASLVRNLSEVIEKDILVRMSLGAVAKDRDWALRQIALGGLTLDDVKVEFAWKAGTDV
jgi:hypothetical protein